MHKFAALCDGRFYEIPKNQRGYSWGEAQISALFNDLLLAGVSSHYMGPIIVSRDSTSPDFQDDDLNTVAKFILEDGQQRLTTAFLIENAIRRRLEKLSGGPDLDSQEIDRLLFYKKGQKLLRLRNANSALNAFLDSIVSGSTYAPQSTTPPMRALREAYDYIEQRFSQATREDLLDWKKRITNQAKFIWVDLATEGVNRYLAFDAINSRGLPLSEFDKIKNFCILVDEVRGLSEKPEEQWFLAIGELETYDVARLEESFIAELFSVFHDKPVGQSAVHSEFVRTYGKLLTKSDAALEGALQGFIRLWPSYAQSFGFIATRKRSKFYADHCSVEAAHWLDRLDNLDLLTITRPLLVSSYLRMSRDEFQTFVRACEIYTFRTYAVLRYRKDKNKIGVNNLASGILRLGKDLAFSLNTICVWLKDMAPLKEVIATLGDGKPKYNHDPAVSGWTYCYYFLYEYELGFSPAGVKAKPWAISQEDKINSQEHILPQEHRDNGWWAQHWPDEAKAERFKHTLGNLVLTAGNSVLGRKPISQKIFDANATYYYKHANATNTEKRIELFADGLAWDSVNILRREFEMLEFAAKRWGIPCCTDNGIINLSERFDSINAAEIKVNYVTCVDQNSAGSEQDLGDCETNNLEGDDFEPL